MQEHREQEHRDQTVAAEAGFSQNQQAPANAGPGHEDMKRLLQRGGFAGSESPQGFDQPKWADIVSPFLAVSSGKKSFALTDPDNYTERLQQERILLLGSFDNAIALQAARLLLDRLSFSSENRFLISCDRENAQVANLSMEFFLEEALPPDFGCVIDVRPLEGQAFLYSLNDLESSSHRALQNRLRELDACIICMVDPVFMAARFPDGCNGSVYWEVPFLEPLLQTHFPEKQTALVRRISIQKQKGSWGKNDEELYRIVTSYLGKNCLEEEIARREALVDGQPPSACRNIAPADLFQEDDYLLPLKKTVLYVAAFFPGLTPHDFTTTVSLFLGDSTVDVPVQTTRTNEDGSMEEVETFETRALLEIWQQKNDTILADTLLTASIEQGTDKTIRFTDPYLGNDLRCYMEQQFPFFMDNQFGIVKRAGLLFFSSGKMLENVINLSVKMALSNAEHHGREWLQGMFMQLNMERHRETATPDNLHGLVEHILEQMEKDIQEHIVYTRISYLIREMLQHVRLQEMVRNFFEQLISHGDHAGLLEIVKRLRNVPGFDEFFWMQQLLERGRKKVRKETYTLLYRHIKNSGPSFASRFEKLVQWLPEPDKSSENYSNANRFSLWFIMVCTIDSLADFKAEESGVRPPGQVLFFGYFSGNGSERAGELIGLLLHPGMPLLFTDNMDSDEPYLLHEHLPAALYVLFSVEWYADLFDTVPEIVGEITDTITVHLGSLQENPEKSAVFLAAVLVAQWFVVLNSSGEEQPADPKAAALLDCLLQAVADHTRKEPAHHQWLTAYWRSMADDLLGIINTIPSGHRLIRSNLLRKRTLIKQLVTRYQGMRKQNP